MKRLSSICFCLLLFIHTVIFFKIRFVAWPEMLAYPWLMAHGFRLYGDIIHPYAPLLPVLLHLVFSMTGFSVFSLQLLTLMTLLICDTLVYFAARRVWGVTGALVSVSAYTVLQITFEGNGLWFDLTSVPLALAAFYLLQTKTVRSFWPIILSGFCLSAAVLMKQNNVVFLIPALVGIYRDRKKILLFVCAVFLPLLMVILAYRFTNQWQDFLYWSIYHPVFVHATLPGFIMLATRKQFMVILFLFSPLLLMKRTWIHLWLYVSLVFAVPRFAYFHLQPAVAFLALCIPAFLLNKKIPLFVRGLYIFGIGIFFFHFIQSETGLPTRFFDDQTMKIKENLEEKVPSGSMVLFINVPAQYFVNTHFIPLKPWSDTFPWYLEVGGLQEKIITSMSATEYAVRREPLSGQPHDLGVYEPQLIIDYLNKHFTDVAVIDRTLHILKRNR